MQQEQPRQRRLAQEVLDRAMHPQLDVARLLQVGGERIAIEFPEKGDMAFMAEFVE
jgi:hypothetical protein